MGQYVSLTGSQASFGWDARDGVALAVKEANASGGIGGNPVTLVARDDGSEVAQVRDVVEQLISKEKAQVIIGEISSALSMAGASVCQAHGVPMITPSSTNPRVTAMGNSIFRVCFIDPVQGRIMARFASIELKASRAAILSEADSAYSQELGNYFSTTFIQTGGKIVERQTYRAGETDFRTQLEAIVQNNPDVLFIPGYYTEAGLISRQAYNMGSTAILLGGDGWDSPKLHMAGGEAIEGGYFSNHFHPAAEGETVQAFVAAFRKTYEREPTGVAALSYDAAKLALAAARTAGESGGTGKAGTSEPRAIRDGLASIQNFDGVTGRISFGNNRDPIKPAVILKVGSTGFEFVTQISP